MRRLREEVRCLKEEITRLREDRSLMPPPPIPQTPLARRGRIPLPRLYGDGDGGGEAPSHLAVVLPSKREWPPAIKPAIRGRRKIMSDDEQDCGTTL